MREHIIRDCISDLPAGHAIPLYYTQMFTAGDETEVSRYLYCIRGTNCCEFYHRVAAESLGHHNMGPLYYVVTLALYDFRYNVDQGIRRLGDCNFYHYEHHRLEQLQLIAEELEINEFKGLPHTKNWKQTGCSFYVHSLSDLLKEDTLETGEHGEQDSNEIPSYLQDIIFETYHDDRLVSDSNSGLQLSTEVFLSPSKILPTERDLANLMGLEVNAAIVVPKQLHIAEYVLFSNMLSSGGYFKGGCLDNIKFTRDWNDISKSGNIFGIRMMVPPIVNALHDVYKKSQKTKAAAMSSKPQLEILQQNHAGINQALMMSLNWVLYWIRVRLRQGPASWNPAL